MSNDPDSLPTYISNSFEPDTPQLGGGRHNSRRGGNGAGGGSGFLAPWKRPKFVATMLVVALVTLLILPDASRGAAHSALTNVGVPLPDQLPDRLQGFIEYLNWNDGRNDLRYVPPPPVETENFGISDEDLKTPHKFNSDNGQLYVEPLSTFAEPPAPHPILSMIKRAENEWNTKVKKQSKTLKDAVMEYQRRYKKNPPRGFDKWWAYVKANRIILVDEYDQIQRDLEPFWAL